MEEDIDILKRFIRKQSMDMEVNTALENLIARYNETKEALQMAKQIMHRDISEDFDYMTLNEFKQYLLKEAEPFED